MSIAKFTKVSEAQYAEAMGDRERMALSEIPLPRRATAGSAGYDFVSPTEVTIPAGGSVLIPTGIRAEMEPGWVLMLFPRSSLGFKHALRLSGERFCQGVFLPYGTAEEDEAFAARTGGMGSTGK